jgi:integrase
VPRITLTDIVLRNLKPGPKQTQFWDLSLPSFGCRVSPRGTKTFNVMTGKERRLIKIGNYPQLSLAEARRQAHELLGGPTKQQIQYAAARDLFFAKHLDTLKPTTAHEQKNLMRRFPFSKPLAAITLDDINRVLGTMPRGSARSCYNVFRTFLNWCVANDHLERTPLKPRSPYKAHSRDRLLSDHEIKLIWAESYNHDVFGAICRCLIASGQRLNQFASFDPSWLKGDLLMFPPAVMKSNAEHVVPATPLLIANLPQLQKPFTNLSTAMNKLREALPIPHHTCHDYRRYFSSTCAALRIAIDCTEAILDHRSGSRSQVQRIYDRFDRIEPMREAYAKYHRHLLDLGCNLP